MLCLVNFISKSIFGRSGTVTNSDVAILSNLYSDCKFKEGLAGEEKDDWIGRYLCCPPSWPQQWYLGGSRDLG